MSGIGAALTVLFCVAVIASPRRLAVLAYVAGALFITQGQVVNLGGLNFMAIRFVEVAAFIRVMARGEFSFSRFTSVDRWLLAFLVVSPLIMALRIGDLDKYALGIAVDGCLVFFTFRALISDFDEFTACMKGLVCLLGIMALLMVVESSTGRNMFSVMGGVPEMSLFRDGHYRAQAGFRHSITAGTVGATFLPLFIGFLFDKTTRRWAGIAAAACLVIVIASRSSGPLMAAQTAIAAWCCWPLRLNMRLIRWGIVGALLAMHLTMSAPAWFIFDRLSGILGGDGWHRSNLIDQFIKHFGEWWLIGMPFENTGDWAATKLSTGGIDVTNYYVSIGIAGGLISLIFFLIVLKSCFGYLGNALQALRDQTPRGDAAEEILWGAGSAVCAHAVNLLAVQYWDQSYVIWYFHLAIAVSLSQYWLTSQALDVRGDVASDQEFAFAIRRPDCY